MSAWILPVAHINAIITTAVRGYLASEDSRWTIHTMRPDADGNLVAYDGPEYVKGDVVEWRSGYEVPGILSKDDATAMGRTLLAANMRSVNARYGERGRAKPYTYTGNGRILTLGELAQAVGSLDYQSCEYDEWYTSKARRFLDRVEHAIYHRIPRETIPGWTGEVHVIDGRHS